MLHVGTSKFLEGRTKNYFCNPCYFTVSKKISSNDTDDSDQVITNDALSKKDGTNVGETKMLVRYI